MFIVDVSNGFTTVEDLHISVDIVPRLIPVQTFNFTVKEGLSRAINAEIINISHPFYSLVNIEFFVEESPQHGDIRYLDGDELTYFTWEEVGHRFPPDPQAFVHRLNITSTLLLQSEDTIKGEGLVSTSGSLISKN